jgi:hypothetical protein
MGAILAAAAGPAGARRRGIGIRRERAISRAPHTSRYPFGPRFKDNTALPFPCPFPVVLRLPARRACRQTMRLLARFLVLMVAVFGVSLAFAWAWDKSDRSQPVAQVRAA